jgi:HlyD family secretion protein
MSSTPDAEVLETIGATHRAVRRRRTFRLVLALCVIGVAAAGIYAWVRASRPTPTSYETRSAEGGDLVVEVTATGTLEPVDRVEVGPEISGRVQAVHADFNDRVEEGQVLVELDDEVVRANANQARAQLRAARAALRTAVTTEREAQSRLTRARNLPGMSGLAAQEVEALAAAADRAVAGVASARAQVAVAQANVAAAEENVRHATIRSPIAGVVLSRSVEPGQTLAATFQTPVLFVLAGSLDRMELHVDVDEADIGRVNEGQRATFTVDAFPDRTFEATVESVHNTPQTVQNVVTYEAVLDAANPEGVLRPGMTATSRIVTEQRDDVLLVPNAALRFRPPDYEDVEESDRSAVRPRRVFVLRDGEPVPVPVEVGPTDGRMTEVTGGELTRGDRVIVDVERLPTPARDPNRRRHP